MGQLMLYKGYTLLDKVTFTDQLGNGNLYYPSLAAGTYTIKFLPKWTSIDVRDYTISVYA